MRRICNGAYIFVVTVCILIQNSDITLGDLTAPSTAANVSDFTNNSGSDSLLTDDDDSDCVLQIAPRHRTVFFSLQPDEGVIIFHVSGSRLTPISVWQITLLKI